MRRTTLVIFLVLPAFINAGIAGIKLAQTKEKPKCDYVPEDREYSCKHIVDVFPNVFYGNYHLKCTDCNIATFRKETFPHTNDLISMNLTSSQIGAIGKGAFQSLGALQYIYLQHNKLKHIEVDAFYGLRQIYELHMEHNEIKHLKQGFLNGFEANSLIMNHNQIEEIPNNVFEGIYGVMTLDLAYNKIIRLNTDSFAHLKGLEYLDLEGNNLCRLPLGMFKHLRLLKDLNLSHNNFKRFQLGTFSSLPNLYSLNISYNSLNVIDPTMLMPMENLSLLDVTNTELDFIEAVEINLNAPQLKHIALAENRWNCRVLQNIIRYLRSKQVSVIEHKHYDVINIKGIACTDNAITNENIPFDIFYKYVKVETGNEMKVAC